MTPDGHALQIIGRVNSPFKEKFGVPRQSGLVDVHSEIQFYGDFAAPECFAGLQQFSHIWVSFIFHQAVKQGWKAKVRPPRLGGNQKLGVFATRSPFRPNHLGLSVARLLHLKEFEGKTRLRVAGLDLVDQTPVVDIKPYIPYADSLQDAAGGFAQHRPERRLRVVFSEQAISQSPGQEFEKLIVDVLGLDPRPAYRQSESAGEFGIALGTYNVCWSMCAEDECLVTAILPLSESV